MRPTKGSIELQRRSFSKARTLSATVTPTPFKFIQPLVGRAVNGPCIPTYMNDQDIMNKIKKLNRDMKFNLKVDILDLKPFPTGNLFFLQSYFPKVSDCKPSEEFDLTKMSWGDHDILTVTSHDYPTAT